MLSLAAIRKKLTELTAIAAQLRASDVYLPREAWPQSLRDEHDKWNAELNNVQGNKYEWLINNADRMPEWPLKFNKRHLKITVGDTLVCGTPEELDDLRLLKARELYELVRGV